ncbi:MAG TPA: universal stress protein [Kofleriaceae bacterium]|nr:universal stress protein [Kofleriaceae bacterium]
MTTRPHAILAAVDDSDFAELVLEHALDLAAQKRDADLHVLGVLEVRHRPRMRDHRRDSALEELERSLRARVEEAIGNLGARLDGKLRVRVHARLGEPHEQILELASECRADIILLGRHGAGGSSPRRTGSVPPRVLADARCPVSVLSPIDYGEGAEAEESCPECAAVRRDSSGERWFCGVHATGYQWRSSVVTGEQLLRDQGIWF